MAIDKSEISTSLSFNKYASVREGVSQGGKESVSQGGRDMLAYRSQTQRV